ncbi:MAG TPA: hypothetical protein VNS09_22350 [Solirubrobacter sp.]|nr:hypothetical protein [Solirubrobacter sp.]
MKKKLLITTALAFVTAAAPAAAVERGVITATGTLNTGESFSCSWTEAPEGDCLGLTGDAVEEVTLLQRYGATRGEFVTSASFGGRPIGSSTRTVQQRADGTWLMTGRNVATGKSWGYVCGGEEIRCVKWEAGTLKSKASATKKVLRKKG